MERLAGFNPNRQSNAVVQPQNLAFDDWVLAVIKNMNAASVPGAEKYVTLYKEAKSDVQHFCHN